jgi:hypothetical protein
MTTSPPEAAVMVKDDMEPAREAAAFLPSRVSESMVKTAPELIVKASPAVLAALSNVWDVLIVAMIYPFSTISRLSSSDSIITMSSGALASPTRTVTGVASG